MCWRASIIACLSVLVVGFACQSAPQQSTDSTPSTDPLASPVSQPRFPRLPPDTTLLIDGMAVTIRTPDTVRADLLVLPGWNYSRTDWCAKTDMCTRALAQGYRLILPEMHRSLYATHYFPETRADFRAERTRPWVWDTLIATLAQDWGVLTPTGKNLVLGLSTGAHGASLLCLDKPAYFVAAACLSGDYDLPRIPHDRITQAVYGPADRFPDRWQLDNPARMASQWGKTAIYLGHGGADKVIPVSQTQIFADTLRALHPHLGSRLVLHLSPTAAHDYPYWGSETTAILAFFQKWLQ